MRGFDPLITWERAGNTPPRSDEIDLGTALIGYFERFAAGQRQEEPPRASRPGPTLGREADTVMRLHELARGGPVLELGVGAGRIARPLAATGIRVDGIDFSAPQVTKLRSMPGGERVSASVGDMTQFALPDRYTLIYCVFN